MTRKQSFGMTSNLFELSEGSEDEGDEAEAEADDEGALHVLGRRLLDQVLIWSR
jgi:hypothetical protein